MTNSELIKSLIRDDLINTKLIYGLGDLGLNADNYLLHLSETVFDLMGFDESQQTDELTERYIEMTECIKTVDIFEPVNLLEKLAEKIHAELLLLKAG